MKHEEGSHGSDAGFSYRLMPERRFECTDGAVPALAGDGFQGGRSDPDLPFRLVIPEDRETLVMALAGPGRPVTLRVARPEGGIARLEAVPRAVTDSAGNVVAIEGRVRELTRRAAHDAQPTGMDQAGPQAARASHRPGFRLTAGGMPLLPGPSLEATAQLIADAVMAGEGADYVSVSLLESPTVMRRIALATRLRLPSAPGDLLPATRVTYLRARASLGPWLDRWVARPEDGAYGVALRDAGFRAVLYVPIGEPGEPRALLAIGSVRRDGLARLAGKLGAALRLAALAGPLLLPQIEALDNGPDVRDAVLRALAGRLFDPVYQPVASLDKGTTLGFEALARFRDGSSPRRLFAAATRVKLGLALEEATLEAALAGAEHLPAGCWLSLHVSPDLVVETDILVRLLAGNRRPIVLLVSERHDVSDYDTLRTKVARLGRHVQLGVDDAGGGTADYRHLVELHPRLVKLDARLVQGIENDAGRQAVLRGLRNLVGSSECELVADGVEMQAERLTLLRLGLRLGMGYLLGGPSEAVLWIPRDPDRDSVEQSA